MVPLLFFQLTESGRGSAAGKERAGVDVHRGTGAAVPAVPRLQGQALAEVWDSESSDQGQALVPRLVPLCCFF